MARFICSSIEFVNDGIYAAHLIRMVVLHRDVHQLQKIVIASLKNYLKKVTLFSRIDHRDWVSTMHESTKNPHIILKSLVDANQYDICYQWIKDDPAVKIDALVQPKLIQYLMEKVCNNSDNKSFMKICKLQLKTMVQWSNVDLLSQVKDCGLLRSLTDFLLEKSPNDNAYRKYKITLSMFDAIDEHTVSRLWDLVSEPLLIIEQFIINSKFGILTTILKVIKPLIKNILCPKCEGLKLSSAQNQSGNDIFSGGFTNGNDSTQNFFTNYKSHCVSFACIDQLLRIYASKALDICVSNQTGSLLMSKELTSLDSLCATYVMPQEAPDKANWIKDEEAPYCMCCLRVVFTILQRRHHCRRCGRVICHICSTRRMTIPKIYESVPVRVCNDCFRQSIGTIKEDDSELHIDLVEAMEVTGQDSYEDSNRDSNLEYRFSGNMKRDSLLRKEFSYEFAPSATLCLNIMSLHRKNQDCQDFLRTNYAKFEKLLKPLVQGHLNPEVDYGFVTRILRCFSIALKVFATFQPKFCIRCSFMTENELSYILFRFTKKTQIAQRFGRTLKS